MECSRLWISKLRRRNSLLLQHGTIHVIPAGISKAYSRWPQINTACIYTSTHTHINTHKHAHTRTHKHTHIHTQSVPACGDVGDHGSDGHRRGHAVGQAG